MSVYDKLKELGISLPGVSAPGGHYVPAARAENLIFTAGQTPKVDGKLVCRGKLGDGVSIDEGYQAARICAVNCLGNIERLAGGLDNIERIVKAVCFVNSAPDFTDQAKVANGATDLFAALFGDKGTPARSAVGMASLPDGASVELELVVKIKDTSLCGEDF